MKLKFVGAIAVIVAATWVGIAQASEKTYSCGGHGESHRHHHRHQHDGKKPCDCGKIWEMINSILVRIDKLETGTPGSPGPVGPVGPAGPPGPAGKTVILKPVLVWPTQPLKPGCAYFNRGPGRRVGQTWQIPIGIVCASSTRTPPVAA